MACFNVRDARLYSDRWLMNNGTGAICALPQGF